MCLKGNFVVSGAKKIRPLGQKVEEEAPRIQSGLKNKAVVEGSDCTLEVKYSGEPTPFIEWRKNGQEVNKGRRLQVINKEGITMLRILSVRKSDSGEYTVLLTNKLGSESSTSKVSISSEGKTINRIILSVLYFLTFPWSSHASLPLKVFSTRGTFDMHDS